MRPAAWIGFACMAGDSGVLLAQTRMADVSRQFRGEASVSNWSTQLGFVLIPIIAVGVALVLYHLYNRPRAVVNLPFGLLTELCRAHQLSGRERRLLERIAEHARLEQPASMFLGTTRFDWAVQAAAANLRLDRRQQALLAELRRRIFNL